MEYNQSPPELRVDGQAADYLTEASRWGKRLGVLILAGIGLFFLLMLLLWNRITGQLIVQDETDEQTMQIVKVVAIIAFLIMAAIAAILLGFLIRGATRIRSGIRNRDQILFNSGLANLRNYFAMYAIIGIIGLFFSLIALLIK